jgi:predicted porin
VKRKVIAAFGALAAGAGAHAQAPSSVSIYGLMDVAVERVTNVGAAGGALTRMPGITGSLPSRLGFRGTEDLGGGLAAVYTLEMGLAPDAGTLNQGGRGFGRQAFVGLTGPWGSFTMGRQYTMLFWSLLDADVIGPAMHSIGSLDSYLPNTRVDNSVAWRGSWNGLSLGTSYSAGRDVVNAGPSPAGTNCAGESATDSNACREWSAMVRYNAAGWGIAAAVDEFRGGPGAFAGLNSSALKDSRATLNGHVKLGSLRLAGGVVRRHNDASTATPRSTLYFLGASHPLGSVATLDMQWSELEFRGSANKAAQLVVRGTYNLSKRTALYASAARLDNDGTAAFSVSGGQAGSNPLPGAAQTGLAVGLRHSF